MTETPGERPTLSIVVLSWNTQELLVSCLASLEPLRRELPLQVIVLDNASHDGSADRVAQDFTWVELVRNERNDGYAIGNNLGAAHATGQYLLLLNSDTEVGAGVLTTLVSFLEQHPGHGACAPKLVYPDGNIQHACMRFPRRMSAVFFDTVFDKWFPDNRELPRYFMRDFDHETSCDVEQPPGAAFLVRKPLWDELGGFDPDLWLFFNDVDLCKRIHDKGHRIAYVAEVAIVHHEGKSTSQFPEFGGMWHRNRLAYYRKHFGFTGGLLARVMTSVRGLEELRRLSRIKAPPEARAELWRAVKGVWKS
jgi:N-acetylglucosaminyl-diphospho-decaprenol L-rhamnosyltransferase